MQETRSAGRLTELIQRSLETLAKEGFDAWVEKFTTPDFVWDVTPMGLGRYEGRAAFREFYEDWISSYEDWFMEPVQIEEFTSDVAVVALRQGGRMRNSEQSVELRFAQLVVWDDTRIKKTVNYSDLEEARVAATEMVAAG
jgi:ketosteroid isomerase-like protein